jgi:hypothetical protein
MVRFVVTGRYSSRVIDRQEPEQRPHRRTRGGVEAAGIVFWMLFAIVAPAVLVLRHVRDGAVLVHSPDPTPYGYTISLAIYVLPILLLAYRFYRLNSRNSFRTRAFFRTILLLVPIGFLLDIVFGNLFFEFPNRLATLGIDMPGYSFPLRGFIRNIPMEEFAFYLTGFVAILLVYNWCNEEWVPAYGVQDYGDPSKRPPYVVQWHFRSLWIAVGLIVAAIVHKKTLAPVTPEHDYREGLPLYFIFLVVAALGPSLVLYRSARPFINWRAFSMTLLWVLLSSLLWEATLASPYEWWTYRFEQMMGVRIKAWAGLPLEAALLWLAVTFTTVIVYETFKIYLHLGSGSLIGKLFGVGQTRTEFKSSATRAVSASGE